MSLDFEHAVEQRAVFTPEFVEFKKIPRWNREIIITEKIDGTNAQILVPEGGGPLWAGSRNRWVTEKHDNYGFGAWVKAYEQEIRTILGPGRHFGEWYGRGVGRGYGLQERRLALFNTSRWKPCGGTQEVVEGFPIEVVPVIYTGDLSDAFTYKGDGLLTPMEQCIRSLQEYGSVLVPGFMKPEGIVIYHTHSGQNFKVTLENDSSPKSMVN